MRLSLFLLGGVATLVSAQGAGAGPPSCGTNTLISIISSSGCSISDAECLCKNTKAIALAQQQIPKSCSATADRQAYANFFNLQCIGKPGFPITMNAAAGSDGRTNKVGWGLLAGAAGIALLL